MLQLTFAVILEYFLRGSFHKCFINLEGFELMKSLCWWEGFNLLCQQGNWGWVQECEGGNGTCESLWIRAVQTLHGISPDNTVLCSSLYLGLFAFHVILQMLVGAKDAPSVLLGQLLLPVLCPNFLPISLSYFFSSLLYLFPCVSPFYPSFHSFFLFTFFIFLKLFFLLFSFFPSSFFPLL